MKTVKTIIIIFFIIAGSINILHAQQGVVSSGGEATGNAGSVNYSVGQVFYHSITNDEGSVNQGLQQPFEIFIVTGIDLHDITLDWKVFPNPTNSILFLKVSEAFQQKLEYTLYNSNGKLVESAGITGTETQIEMHRFERGAYILTVSSDSRNLKQFKVIKN